MTAPQVSFNIDDGGFTTTVGCTSIKCEPSGNVVVACETVGDQALIPVQEFIECAEEFIAEVRRRYQ